MISGWRDRGNPFQRSGQSVTRPRCEQEPSVIQRHKRYRLTQSDHILTTLSLKKVSERPLHMKESGAIVE